VIPQLQSAWAKLERADKHIFEFGAWVQTTFAADSYTVVKETEPDGLHEILKIQYHTPIIPSPVIAIVGDAVHNLRSALDHLACAIALRHNPNTRLENIAFPICKSREVFNHSGTQGKIRVLGPAGEAFIRSLKPYAGDDGIGYFWTLHRLDVTDKHRALLTTGIFGAADSIGPEAARVIQFSAKRGDWQSLEKDVVIARWCVGEPEPNVFQIFNVAFNEPEIVGKEPAFAVLMNARALVEWTLGEAERDIAW
jgi:hypothetical protein